MHTGNEQLPVGPAGELHIIHFPLFIRWYTSYTVACAKCHYL